MVLYVLQVLSRHFGRGEGADKECFMLPFIDMCNHSFDAQEHTRCVVLGIHTDIYMKVYGQHTGSMSMQ